VRRALVFRGLDKAFKLFIFAEAPLAEEAIAVLSTGTSFFILIPATAYFKLELDFIC